MTRILVTGGRGFIGQNLIMRLSENGYKTTVIGSDATQVELARAARDASFVIHLAGTNRPSNQEQFVTGNLHSTERLCAALLDAGNAAPILFASSTQALAANPYGASKRAAEELLLAHGITTGARIFIYRLPNVFGKWARPHYNSAVATFCHESASGREINVHDPAARLTLAHVDDVIDTWLGMIKNPPLAASFREVVPTYATTVGEVATIIEGFARTREAMFVPQAGSGLNRALFATYLTYLPLGDYESQTTIHSDSRGDFAEFVKTYDSGQVSYLTVHPGVTRGEHYHHSKTEKFLVVTGKAHFAFRSILTDETYDIIVDGGKGKIIDTIPGWAHSIKNISDDLMIVILWANEIFDKHKPDTIAYRA